MVTFKHKESGHTKTLPDMYGKGIYLTSELNRGYELVKPTKGVKEPKQEANELITVRKGSDEYKDLIQKATDKVLTLEQIKSTYKISAAIEKELIILLD